METKKSKMELFVRATAIVRGEPEGVITGTKL
jgi:hypothetical protein